MTQYDSIWLIGYPKNPEDYPQVVNFNGHKIWLPRPLANSFDLARQLRQAASGHVTFHMAFSHWELSEDGAQKKFQVLWDLCVEVLWYTTLYNSIVYLI